MALGNGAQVTVGHASGTCELQKFNALPSVGRQNTALAEKQTYSGVFCNPLRCFSRRRGEFPRSTTPTPPQRQDTLPRRCSADGALMTGVTSSLELEGAVIDVEAARQARLQLIEQRGKVAVVKARVVHDDVSRQHR